MSPGIYSVRLRLRLRLRRLDDIPRRFAGYSALRLRLRLRRLDDIPRFAG